MMTESHILLYKCKISKTHINPSDGGGRHALKTDNPQLFMFDMATGLRIMSEKTCLNRTSRFVARTCVAVQRSYGVGIIYVQCCRFHIGG